jgi:hypothetical protein
MIGKPSEKFFTTQRANKALDASGGSSKTVMRDE